MKLVFVHDHIFKQDTKGNFYTAGAFNNRVWKRYLNNFADITVIARLNKHKITSGNKYNEFSLPELNFKQAPSLSGPLNQIKNKKKAINVIKQELENADALIARLPSELGNLAVELAKEVGKPYVIEVVGCVWDSLWNYGSLQAKLYAPIAMRKMKNRVKKSPNAIYVTSDFLQKRYPCKGKTENISNVELQDVSDKALRDRLERYKENKKLYTIGTIGSLDNKIKGLDIALKALSYIKKQGIDFQLQVLGDGKQEQWIELAQELGIEEEIKFCGTLSGGDPVLEWLDQIDVYIQPSFQEGLPRAVIEAMSRGCPVVGSSAGGIPELIDEEQIHSPGDYRKLSKRLKAIMMNIDYATKVSLKNQETSKQYISDILNDKRSRFLNQLIK